MANENWLIDANELYTKLSKMAREPHYQHDGEDYYVGIADASGAVVEAPTVDAVEVVHGRWFMRGGIFRCSECDSKALLKLDSNVGGCREYTHFRSPYCPHCGAKMDGDGNGN